MALTVDAHGERRMTEDTGGATRVALEELLDRVVPHIQVFLQDDLIDLAEYRKVLLQARASNDAHDKSRVNSYEVKIQDQNLSDEIRNVIERELSEYIHDNKVRTAVVAMHRLPHMDFSVTAAIQRLLDLSIILGAEEAANGFVRSLEADSCPYRRLTLLGGVTVEEEIPLYDGIRLLALPDINESLSSTFPDLLPDSELRHRFREAVLIEEERTISPQFMRPDDDSKFLTKATSQEAPDFDPGAFCLILSLVTKRQAYVSMQWTNMPEDEFINLLSGGAFLYFSVQSPELSMPFSANEIAEARTVYDQFRSAPANIKRRLEIPLTRLAASTNPTRSRIDTTIDLERAQIGG